MILTSAYVLYNANTNQISPYYPPESSAVSSSSISMAGVPHNAASVSRMFNSTFSGSVSVLVTFNISNQTSLNTLLSNLYNTQSPYYHDFISRQQFEERYGPPQQAYDSAVAYFSSFNGLSVKTYSDHLSIQVNGPASEVGKALNTTFVSSSSNMDRYSSSAGPELPSTFADYVSYVSGLSNIASAHLIGGAPSSGQIQQSLSKVDGYPSPVSSNGVQYIYGSDMQVAYGEQSLLNVTYPTHQVIATLLWSGQNSSGQNVGAFNPSDISAYFNATLPSYEPHPHVYGVPVNGAPQPGISASYDATGANQENTLDLEMVGSTAPGASIYNVYGPNATYESIDSALAFILNPNATYSALNNVSVITNSWGGADYNNTVWYSYMQEASARGITVLASSGDSGDNNLSSKYTGSQVQFPSTMAYNDFGVTAVGGTTVTLTNSLHLSSEIAWNISSSDSADGGPAGSVGGISQIFKEPSWQVNTEANSVIRGAGRGVPDISAIANNTLVFITINGVYEPGQPFGGTSIASPLTAGLIAEMDAVLNHYNNSNLGYLNPILYSLGNRQVTPMSNTTTTGYIMTGSDNSTIPMQPYYDVVNGNNDAYNATYGYDLVTGWGSINAYNFTNYVLDVNYSNIHYALKGVRNNLTLNALNVTSYLYHPSTNSFTVNTQYNASIQQNFFVADQLGAPIYWVQNVVYINGSESAGWAVNYSGWVIYPFYGLYPTQTIYEYNFPMGEIVHMPHEFNVTSWISNVGSGNNQEMNFEINSHIVQLPIPGGAYIIGMHNYSYSWEGKTYLNGPYPGYGYEVGGLDPQFGLVGGPSSGDGLFGAPTAGSMNAYVEEMGSNTYVVPATSAYGSSIDQTGETSTYLTWTRNGTSGWNIGTNNNSLQQGVLSYVPDQYSVLFNGSGLPAGQEWYVNITGENSSGPITESSYSVVLGNGTYTYTVSTPNKGYTITYGSSFKVAGNATVENIGFTHSYYHVTFTESGLPAGASWYVNITGIASSGAITGSHYTTLLPNGSYTYTLGSSVYGYSAEGSSFKVAGSDVSQNAAYTNDTYRATFSETGLLQGAGWFVNITGMDTSGALTASYYSTYLVNGTYDYSIGSANSTYFAPGGKFTVNGSAVDVHITFNRKYYSATFIESNLHSGTSWWLKVNNIGNFYSDTGSIMADNLTNGTYGYEVGSNNSTFAPLDGSGTFAVSGQSVTVAIPFTEYKYEVTINEKGLPSGTAWFVNLSDGSTLSTSSAALEKNLTNGTFTISVRNLTDYYSVNYSTSFTVSGQSANLTVYFYHYSYITGTANPSGSSVSVDGKQIKVSSGRFNISVTAGKYNVTAKDSGYNSYYSNFTLSPGQVKNLSIDLKPVKTAAPPGNTNYDMYYAMGGISAGIIVIGALALRRKKL